MERSTLLKKRVVQTQFNIPWMKYGTNEKEITWHLV